MLTTWIRSFRSFFCSLWRHSVCKRLRLSSQPPPSCFFCQTEEAFLFYRIYCVFNITVSLVWRGASAFSPSSSSWSVVLKYMKRIIIKFKICLYLWFCSSCVLIEEVVLYNGEIREGAGRLSAAGGPPQAEGVGVKRSQYSLWSGSWPTGLWDDNKNHSFHGERTAGAGRVRIRLLRCWRQR